MNKKTKYILAGAAVLATAVLISRKKKPEEITGIGDETWYNLPGLHLLEITYIGPTNYKPGRIKINSHLYRQSVILSANDNEKDMRGTATAYLLSKGYILTGRSQTKNGYAILSTTFKPLK